MAPFPTANPLVGLTIWMWARLAGAAGSAGGRSLGHPAGAAVEVVVAGAVVVVLVMPPADLPLETELQAAPRTRPTTRRIRMRVTTPSWPARPTTAGHVSSDALVAEGVDLAVEPADVLLEEIVTPSDLTTQSNVEPHQPSASSDDRLPHPGLLLRPMVRGWRAHWPGRSRRQLVVTGAA